MSNIPTMRDWELYSAFGGQLVFVYYNLHSKMWSVRSRTTGRVIAHCTQLTLSQASPVVSEAGRQRVIRERRKNVHAGIVGVVSNAPRMHIVEALRPFRSISYNPYWSPWFFYVDDRARFDCADYVTFDGRKVSVSKWIRNKVNDYDENRQVVAS